MTMITAFAIYSAHPPLPFCKGVRWRHHLRKSACRRDSCDCCYLHELDYIRLTTQHQPQHRSHRSSHLYALFAIDSDYQHDHDHRLCHLFDPSPPALLQGRPMEAPPPQERLPQGSEMGSRESIRVSDLGITCGRKIIPFRSLESV